MNGTKTISVVLGAIGLLAFATIAQAQGILDTKHNLSTGQTGTGNIRTTDGTERVCVFCHTPHGADTAVAAPLWNRKTATGPYTPYTSPSFDAGTANVAPPPSGTSLACLSCHDGTIAFDALRNLPGSGGYDPTAPSAGWSFERIGSGAIGNTMPAGITNIGTDLTNDHPISMIYVNAFSPSSASGTNDHTTGFNDPPGGISATGDSYFANGVKISAGLVQCTSCHDPHRADTPTFLRTNNNASNLCLTCHRKNV